MWRERIRSFAEHLAGICVHLVDFIALAQSHLCSWNVDSTHFSVKLKNILQVSAGWSLG